MTQITGEEQSQRISFAGTVRLERKKHSAAEFQAAATIFFCLVSGPTNIAVPSGHVSHEHMVEQFLFNQLLRAELLADRKN
ncbi:MAG: hypothetical protein ACRERD_26380 [Candidatus Binatia bacterium]